MASLGIDGLSSGLDTTAIIASLMQIESAPQTLLKRKQATTQDVVSALQGINTKVRSLFEAAGKAAAPANWTSFSTSSSSTAATATASTRATSATLTFSVDAVATSQMSLSDLVPEGGSLLGDPPTLTIRGADGTLTTVTAASGSAEDVAKAVTDAGAGVTATVVKVPSGAGVQHRVQFTGEGTGTDGAFEILAGGEAAVAAGTAARLDGSIARAGGDASITLWKGTAYEQSYTQSSNTCTDIMTGVDVTVSRVTDAGEPVTIDVAPDASKVKGLASGLIGALSVVLSDMDSRTATTTTTKDDGTKAVTGGVLSGDSAVRMLRSQLVQAATYPIDGRSPSSVGIEVGRDGTISFDEEAFAAAVAEDPDGTAAFVQALADRVATVADSASDPYEGSLTQKVTGQQTLVERYSDQIAEWDLRLESRRATLQTTYTNLEVTLSNLNSQSSWLAGQLSSLSTS